MRSCAAQNIFLVLTVNLRPRFAWGGPLVGPTLWEGRYNKDPTLHRMHIRHYFKYLGGKGPAARQRGSAHTLFARFNT